MYIPIYNIYSLIYDIYSPIYNIYSPIYNIFSPINNAYSPIHDIYTSILENYSPIFARPRFEELAMTIRHLFRLFLLLSCLVVFLISRGDMRQKQTTTLPIYLRPPIFFTNSGPPIK